MDSNQSPCFQGTYLLAASNDFASRIWTVDDYRLRVSLCPDKVVPSFIIDLIFDDLCCPQVDTLVMSSFHVAVIKTRQVCPSSVLWSVMYSKRSEVQAPPSAGPIGSLQPPPCAPPCSSSAAVVSMAADIQDVTSQSTECVYKEPAVSV